MKKWGILFAIVLLIGCAVWLVLFRTGKVKLPHRKSIVKQIDTADIAHRKYLYSTLDSFFTARSIDNGFSGSVLVSVKGEPVYEKCFGYCDYRSKDLMTDTNSFQLASVSKTFTATAVLWLVEHGKLSLQDTLQKFFANMPYKNVTIQMLLCHRSGLPNYLYFCDKKATGGAEYITNSDVVNIIAKQKPSAYALPDKKFEYCNTNYVLLACIVEKVTGKKFKTFMEETFFKPLGMSHTFIYNAFDTLDRKIAISYNSKWQIQHDDCFDGVVGDKGVYSTVHDMFTWDKAFYDGKLLSQKMMQEAYAPRSFEKPGVRNYGYGWRLIQKPDSNYLVYHNGWWHGNNTVFCRNIQDTTAIIILSNRFNKSVYNIQPVWQILYGVQSDTSADQGEE